ncbi:hypothetical protein CZ771_05275 [Actinomycetales bacterium JB111]|nr:hypothetical protein CZ771_05275 [Actinomycetales bacterium JB111]
MGWEDAVLADLSGEFDAEQRAGQMAEAADLVEAEAATRTLASRWRQMTGARLSLTLLDGNEVAGEVLDANDNWLLLAEGPRRALVPADAVALVRGLGRSGPEAGGVVDRLSFASALRRIAEEAVAVRVTDAASGRTGRILRVGADHLDLRVEPGGQVVAVALRAIRVVRTA